MNDSRKLLTKMVKLKGKLLLHLISKLDHIGFIWNVFGRFFLWKSSIFSSRVYRLGNPCLWGDRSHFCLASCVLWHISPLCEIFSMLSQRHGKFLASNQRYRIEILSPLPSELAKINWEIYWTTELTFKSFSVRHKFWPKIRWSFSADTINRWHFASKHTA